MSFDLPDNIVIIIFHCATKDRQGYKQHWKDSLRLLAVSKKWRYAVLPLVYADVYVSSNKSRFYQEKIYNLNGHEALDTPFWSNAELIKSAGCAQSVKNVYVNVLFKENILWQSLEIAKLLQTNNAQYPNATVLAITINLIKYTTTVPKGRYNQSQIIENLADALKCCLPSVQEFELRGNLVGRHPQLLYNVIVGCYASQLKSIVSCYSVDTNTSRLSMTLTKLDFNFIWAKGKCRLPINLETLEYLRLVNLSKSYKWVPCCESTLDSSATFANLKKLEIKYSCIEDKPNNTAIVPMSNSVGKSENDCIYFPRLQELYLEDFSHDCLITTHAVLPNAMTNIALSSSVAAITDFARKSTLKVDNLYVTFIANNGDSSDSIYTAEKTLTGNFTVNKCIELALNDNYMPIAPSLIKASNITKLTMYAAINVNTMCEFINSMPKLVYLLVRSLDLQNLPDYIPVPASAAHPEMQLAPFNTRIRELHIGYDNDYFELSEFEHTVQYFMLRIPSLSLMVTGGPLERNLANFVYDYKKWYPHLQNIRNKD